MPNNQVINPNAPNPKPTHPKIAQNNYAIWAVFHIFGVPLYNNTNK
jgi:hypothetical protein